MNITNDKVSEYINSYYMPLDDELAELRSKSEENRIPIILKETEVFLRSLLLTKKPGKILEIGTATGYSAGFFAKLLPEAQIVTIESFDERYAIASENFKVLGVDNRVKIILGKGEEVLESLAESGESGFDFVFIDAAKSFYIDFFTKAEKLCTDDAVIVADNVLMRAMTASDEFDTRKRYKTNVRHLREFVDFLMSSEKHYTSILAVGDGVSITQLNNKKL